MLDNAHLAAGGQKTLRCAIYTRKSHEEGLEQEFNSLDAQREAGEAYVESQRLQGWTLLPDRFDDGGFSGGNMERPALKRLLAAIDAGEVDIIVVYKIDRLSRSLLDFMKMIEHFNAKGVSFVSVTQHFSTTDPTGRMFLGILITFAQYEREVIAERIRDKVAAAKRRGKYCGGAPILGYDVDPEQKKLQVNTEEAQVVQFIFRRFLETGSVMRVGQELNEQGYRTKAWTTRKGRVREGAVWSRPHLYRILNNRQYIGEIAHKGEIYPGEHQGIIDRSTWDKVQAVLASNEPQMSSRTKTLAPLKGVIRCGHCQCAMAPTYTKKNGRLYSYYLCDQNSKRVVSRCPVQRVPAGDIERAVVAQLSAVFRTPTWVAQTYFAAREIEQAEAKRLEQQLNDLEKSLATVRQQAIDLMQPAVTSADQGQHLLALNRRAVELTHQIHTVTTARSASDNPTLSERDIAEAFDNLERLWEDLFPVERHQLIRLMVASVEVREDSLELELKTQGLASVVTELAGLCTAATERRTAA